METIERPLGVCPRTRVALGLVLSHLAPDEVMAITGLSRTDLRRIVVAHFEITTKRTIKVKNGVAWAYQLYGDEIAREASLSGWLWCFE